MLLKSLNYSEYQGESQEWRLNGLTLGMRNLLVGKNATGKSRTLNVIGGVANNLTGERPPAISGKYEVVFSDGARLMEYSLEMKAEKVVAETFSVDGRSLLERGTDGEGKIFAEKVIPGGTMMDFQTPQNEVAAFVRRDSKQHSFLELLHLWASSVRHYHFGTALGKDSLAVPVKRGGVEHSDGKDPNKLVGLFHRAKRDFPKVFVDTLLADMERVDYPLESIVIGPPVSIRFESQIALPDPVGLVVQERGLKGVTDQLGMSQGMFRVLSLLIMVNYLECTQLPGCILIDDIGEGLDFDRSCLLIDLLREKSQKCGIQFIASTNDRFVMNKIPLGEWSVLQRRGSQVEVLNSQNSKELFEEFRFTGLSNFSFLEMDFPNTHSEQDAVAHE